jgi:hypothetical protein
VYCWEELFRPHEDLLPLFFQFYAGVLRNGYDIPADYRSRFRPATFREYKKPAPTTVESSNGKARTVRKEKESPAPSTSELKTFE